MPYTQQITIYRGDTFTQMLRLRQRQWNPLLNQGQGGWMPGAYRDLTGWSGGFQIRTQPDSPAAAATGVVTIMDQTTTPGGITYTMSPAQTATLVPDPLYQPYPIQDPTWPSTTPAGTSLAPADALSPTWGGWMYYDVQLTTPAGEVYTYVAGPVKFIKDVTHV